MKSRSNKHIKGIDISNWQQGANLKEAVKKGYQVAIFKATEGVDFKDKCFEEFYKEGKAAGLKIGAYHFMSDKTDPKQQAKDFYDAIKDKDLEVIPVLDIEKETKGRNKTQVTDRCIAFLEEFRRLSGLDCIVYTYTSFANSYMDSRLSKYKLWIAEYGKNDGNKQTPSSNSVWNDWVGFQFTSNGKINGFPGPVDLNEFTEGIFKSGQIPEVTKPVEEEKEIPLWKLCINGSLVLDLQKEINNQNFGPVKEDSYFGTITLEACPTLRAGATGNITRIMQKRLIALGYNIHKGADGIFGARNMATAWLSTEGAIMKFQKKCGLKVDGIVGQATWKALFLK